MRLVVGTLEIIRTIAQHKLFDRFERRAVSLVSIIAVALELVIRPEAL